jgi:ABC-type bacteriocin/lantibiotic exporter with double-glycine peptidase domain
MRTLGALCLQLMATLVALTACSTSQPPSLVERSANMLPSQVELTQVPFFPQEDDQCGPAALAMVFTHAGMSRTPEQMRDEVYLPRRQGSLPIEMVSAARRNGLSSTVLAPNLHELLQQVSNGHPVTVLLNVRWRVWPQWHYAVVVGFDLSRNQVVLRSGLEERQLMSLQEFESQWAAADRWAMVVRRQGQGALIQTTTR